MRTSSRARAHTHTHNAVYLRNVLNHQDGDAFFNQPISYVTVCVCVRVRVWVYVPSVSVPQASSSARYLALNVFHHSDPDTLRVRMNVFTTLIESIPSLFVQLGFDLESLV